MIITPAFKVDDRVEITPEAIFFAKWVGRQGTVTDVVVNENTAIKPLYMVMLDYQTESVPFFVGEIMLVPT